jgi:hypothetical protein
VGIGVEVGDACGVIMERAIGFEGCLILKTTTDPRKMTARMTETHDFTSDGYSVFIED